MRALRLIAAASLGVSTLLFLIFSWHWPLVGDAALIHYIAFLIERGWAPYRDLGDMNMPGSFLIEIAVMHLFGGSALGLRLFDFSLLAAAAAAFLVITRKPASGWASGWFPALFAAALLALVHGRDGLAEGGQRDLTMAVLLVVATAFLLLAVRRTSALAMLGFGLCAGVALTIKPTALPLSLAQGTIAWSVLRHHPVARRRGSWWAAGGLTVGPAIALVFLLVEGVVPDFLAGLHGIVPYYASLGHRPLGYLLLHSISPLLPLVLPWLAVLALARPKLDWQRAILACGAVFGLASYVIQARGLPYYRYPLLAFLLPLMALDFEAAIDLIRAPSTRLKAASALAAASICIGGIFLAPQSAVLIHRVRWWQTDFINSLEQNLNRLGGPRLSGHIQCIDSVSGCGATMYKMQLVPSTGVLSDFLLFGSPDVPVIASTRANFSAAFNQSPPQAIVISSWLHINGPGEYRKLDRWPAFESFLADRYQLDTEWTPTRTERWWSREEYPAGYRIYVLRR